MPVAYLLLASVVILVVAISVWPQRAFAHCDTMDGPVVTAARRALETGDVEELFMWVPADDEGAIRAAFEQTQAVRTLSPAAQELADRYFFETVVRIHRAGEGAPYTGLKPAGLDLGPAIPATDKAIESGDLQPLETLLVEAVRDGLRERFQRAMAAKGFDPRDSEAGRAFVAAYVETIHYAVDLYDLATGADEE